MSKALLGLKEKMEIDFLKSKSYTEINDIMNALNCIIKDSREEIESLKTDKVFYTYDGSDGEVFCCFTNKEQAHKDAKDSGCLYGESRLIRK